MPDPVVHVQVTGKDVPKLQKFYADAFGWETHTENPAQYALVQNVGPGVDGGIATGDGPLVTFYVAVQDPAEHLKKIQSLGGEVVMDVTTIPGMVTMAQFKDPEGNVVGIVANVPPPAQ